MIPLLALLLLVITGFVALTIDAGVSYTQSRVDQSGADSAALAAAYWLSQNQISTVNGAATAAENVAYRLCTTPSAPCSLTVNFYTSYTASSGSGTVACSETGLLSTVSAVLSLSGTCGLASTISDVGVDLSTTSSDYLANLGSGARTHKVAPPEAVAVVPGPSSAGSIALPCQICDLGPLTVSAAKAGLYSTGGSINVDGAVQLQSNGDCLYAASNSTPSNCSASQATLYDIYLYGATAPSYNAGASVFPSSAPNYETGTINGQSAFSDPLASLSPPDTLSSAGPPATWTAPNSTSLTEQGGGDYTSTSCPSGTVSIPYGIYHNITLDSPGCTYDFSGYYMITGEFYIEAGSITLSQPNGSFVNFYFLCGTAAQPAACAAASSGGWFNDGADSALVDFKAPTSGTMGNILFYFDRNDAGGLDSTDCASAPHANYCGIDTHAHGMGGTAQGALYMAGAAMYIGAAESGVFLAPIVCDGIYLAAAGTGIGYASGALSVSGSIIYGGLVH